MTVSVLLQAVAQSSPEAPVRTWVAILSATLSALGAGELDSACAQKASVSMMEAVCEHPHC